MPGLVVDDAYRSLSDVLVGQVLPGNDGRSYPLRERIGEGGQGWVFRATWNGGVDVVVKVLRPDAASNESLARFQREAHVLRMISQQASPNPHVVRFLDHASATVQVAATGKSWQVAFTVLELVEGETLERALERAHPYGLGVDRARRILRHVVLALEDVHAHNVVHRDLKPSNILLASPGAREIAKVTDFGLAKLLDAGMHRTTQLAGATVGYAPPEQFEDGNLRVGRHTDVFSLAAIFYELITGRPAFPIKPNDHPLMVIVRILSEARPAFARVPDTLPRDLAERTDVVHALDAELFRALSPDPGERHPTVEAFHQGIERAFAMLGAADSIARGGGLGGVVVRGSALPGIWDEREPLALAKTALEAPAPRATAPVTQILFGDAAPLPADAPAPIALEWRRVTASVAPARWLTVAVHASGGAALGVGQEGAGHWHGGSWTPIDLPSTTDPRAMRAGAWRDDTMILAGASPLVTALSPGLSPAIWRFDRPGIVFHGAYADTVGILLAGEQATAAGAMGLVVEIPIGADASPPRVLDVPGAGPLRAVTRLGSTLLACGDGGALVEVLPGSVPRVARVCEPSLFAVLATPGGTAVTVGGGGFVFRVGPSLEAQLDAIQTTRDLFALAQAPGGTQYCGGASGRVLRRDPESWMRVGGRVGPGSVRALHANGSRLLVFTDDGAVVERVLR